MRNFIFDLDHTVIDSGHRYKTLPNGDIDLDHWLRNSKIREQVFRDRLLPLAAMWKFVLRKGHFVTIATARTMGLHDWDYLSHNGLKFHHAVYRRDGDNAPDGLLKTEGLEKLFVRSKLVSPKNSVMYDDNPSVREAVSDWHGIRCIDPIPINARMAS